MSPKFPVICISSNRFLNAARSMDLLETGRTTRLSTGFYEQLKVVDVEGRVFSVDSVVWRDRGLARVWRRGRNAIIHFDLTLRFDGNLALDEVKALVDAAMVRLPEQWEAREDLSRARKRMQQARSVSDLAELLAEE